MFAARPHDALHLVARPRQHHRDGPPRMQGEPVALVDEELLGTAEAAVVPCDRTQRVDDPGHGGDCRERAGPPRRSGEPEALEILFAQPEVVPHLVANRDLDLLDEIVAVAADLLEVLLEEDHPRDVLGLLRDLGLGARNPDVEAQNLRRDVLLGQHAPTPGSPRPAPERSATYSRIERGRLSSASAAALRNPARRSRPAAGSGRGRGRWPARRRRPPPLRAQALEHQGEVVEGVARLRIQGDGDVQRAPGLGEAASSKRIWPSKAR